MGIEQESLGIEHASLGIEQVSLGIEQASFGIEQASLGIEQESLGIEQEEGGGGGGGRPDRQTPPAHKDVFLKCLPFVKSIWPTECFLIGHKNNLGYERKIWLS